ncbi:MAG TPA: head GIN domain-containing protein [Bacteroidia bacterium]
MMLPERLYTCFLILAVLTFSACKKENRCDCIKRTGPIIRDVRHINGFEKILVEDNLNVFITEDPAFEVTVEAGENVAGLIRTEVVDGTLFIRNKNRCNWARSFKKPLNVYVKIPKLTYLTSDGTGDVKSLNTITSDTLDVQTKNSGNIFLTVNNMNLLSHMHGSGDVTFNGIATDHYASVGGTAYLYAGGLQTNYTYIHSYTLGLSYIRANNLLICRLDDIGDIFCYGRPATVEQTKNGSGQLYFE